MKKFKNKRSKQKLGFSDILKEWINDLITFHFSSQINDIKTLSHMLTGGYDTYIFWGTIIVSILLGILYINDESIIFVV